MTERTRWPRVIGGKPYEWGNHIQVVGRTMIIEFDSDYSITKTVTGKNVKKRILKEIERIPDPVSLKWLEDNGWDVPEECWKYA